MDTQEKQDAVFTALEALPVGTTRVMWERVVTRVSETLYELDTLGVSSTDLDDAVDSILFDPLQIRRLSDLLEVAVDSLD